MVVVLNAAQLKSLLAVQLPRQHLLVAPRPQHLAVVAAKEFLVEACLEVEVAVDYLAEVVAYLEEAATVAVDATPVVDATAAVEAYSAVADLVAVLDSAPFPLALQKPSATTKSF